MTAPTTDSASPDLFLATVAELETKIVNLKHRYHQMSEADIARTELLERRNVVKARGRAPEHRQELQEIDEKLASLEQFLDNQGTAWEPFWWAVRFGGLGLLMGWGLKTWLN